ncbi:MAG: sensor histidine kinase [Bacteroidota bacterium]
MPDHSARQLECLLELTRNLNGMEHVDSYLQQLLSAAVELTGSETASILEIDREAAELRFTAVPGFRREIFGSIRVPLDASIAGWVVRNGAPLVIPDVATDERHFRQADLITGFRTRSILAVPLRYADMNMGAFEVLNKTKDETYTDDDVILLETLAGLASGALQGEFLERRSQTSLKEMSEFDKHKSDFIAITSHELRTPLGLILGHATFLRETLGDQYSEQVDAIIRNASKLKEIVESLSRVENFQSGTARIRHGSVSIARIAEEVAASFEQVARQKNISLQTEAHIGKLSISADANKIAIALSNLVKNALTFTNENGHVLIRVDIVPGFVQVSVRDDGIGIPAADLPHIFERFFQVESHLTRRYGGMGLGLSVAKSMIEMHGGRIWAESTEGKGSTFTFLLPVEPP